MHTIWKLGSTLLLLLICSSFVTAESSVWKVTKAGNTLYLAGTFHLLNASDHPLPVEFERAYSAADEVIFETDIAASETPEFQMQAMQAMMLTNGKTLESSLSASTFKKLADYAQSRQLPISTFATFSPAGVSLLLSVMEYQRLGMSPEYGVDAFFHRKAVEDAKTIGKLENLEEQLGFIAEMGKGKEDEMILSTLRELERAESLMAQMKSAWAKGDLTDLYNGSAKEMREQFPETFHALLTKRNNNWMPKIEAMLKDKNVEVVMVGALHMAGPEGLVKQLETKGYTVEQLR